MSPSSPPIVSGDTATTTNVNRNRIYLLAITLLLATFFRPSTLATVGGASGEEEGYWLRHSVIVAQVIELAKHAAGKYYDRLRLTPVGTLSGCLDSGSAVELDMGTEIFTSNSVIGAYPKSGEVIVAVVDYVSAEQSELPGFYIYNGYAAYMPGWPGRRVTLHIIEPGSSTEIDDTVTAIQKARKISDSKRLRSGQGAADLAPTTGFWHDHCLLCGEVVGVDYPDKPGEAPRLTLLPKLTVSGQFDAGKTPKITFDAPIKEGVSLPTAGSKILVLLNRDGERYRLYPERAEFMPGEHASIATIVDYLGPRVFDTAKAVQESRAKARKAKKVRDVEPTHPEAAETRASGSGRPLRTTTASPRRSNDRSRAAPGNPGEQRH
jgi:hypothetical protein